MPRRQTSLPRQWFIVDRPLDREMRSSLRRLPAGAGVLVLAGFGSRELRRLASARKLAMIEEGERNAARVHGIRELRHALSRRTPLILLSPLYPTASHPDWRPIPRMRAAALARLGGRGLVALGGMDSQKFRRVERLGFQGWAGISAWRKRPRD